MRISGSCTAVTATLRRAARERPNGLAIVISDAESTCQSAEMHADFRPENKVFLIPVGSRQHSIEESFDSIRAKCARVMPWAEVIESYRLETVMNAITHAEFPMTARH